jgi:hypothetical protein
MATDGASEVWDPGSKEKVSRSITVHEPSQQLPGVTQIGRVKPLGELGVALGQQLLRLFSPALHLQEAAQAHRVLQLPGRSLLPLTHLNGLKEAGFGCGGVPLLLQQLALHTVQLGFLVSLASFLH